MIWHDPTHQPTHPPNHTPTHGWGILYKFQILKQNQIILICSSVMEFLLILGVPPGGWQVGGLGWQWVWLCEGMSHACTHTHVCCKHDKHGCLHGGSHLQFLYMHTCPCIHVCACACMHVYVHMCGDTPSYPQTPPHPPALSPELQGAQNTKIQ